MTLKNYGDKIFEGLPVPEVEQAIDQDNYYSALYEAESGRNPLAVPKTKSGKLLSSAKGGFQFLNSTARMLKLKNPFDLGESFDKVIILTHEHAHSLKSQEPDILYSAHYLGITVLKKYQLGKELNEMNQLQVQYLEKKALPDFMKIYDRIKKERFAC